MINIPNTNRTKNMLLKFYSFEILCTVKIMKLLETFLRLNNFNSLLTTHRILI